MDYAELHCRTNFSFLEGASHPSELVERAHSLHYSALAITDENSLAGVVRAHGTAKELGQKIIIGSLITPSDGLDVVLLAANKSGYANLSQLITRGRRNAPKGECSLTVNDIAEFRDGLFACVSLSQVEFDSNRSQLARYRALFEGRSYLLAELHRGPDDQQKLAALMRLSNETQVPLVAAGDVYYHVRARLRLQHVMTAIRHGMSIHTCGEELLPNGERHLRPLDEIEKVFRECPEVVARTVEIADQCAFSLDELRYNYPRELAPSDETPFAYLQRLTWEGANRRYPDGVPERVAKLIEHELSLIHELDYEAYFLTVYDIVRFARSRDILCQGRGSAANSAVCYCLEVTSVDPFQLDVLFERFISRERNEAPDIDIDFEHERREEVLQYLYEKYGRERAGLAATVITYKSRSAIRDVGKALGLSLDQVDALAKNVDGHGVESSLEKRLQMSGIDSKSKTGAELVELVSEVIGFPRHLSQHVGGMVMTESRLCELVPIENAAMDGRTVIQWDKDDLDELGFLKVDCLCLGMLTAIRKCFRLLERHTGKKFTLANIPEGDADTYAMIQRAETIGVFQIESRAQMSMLPRLKPRCWYDLVIEVAIVRPGPIQGNMVHPYLRRRNGEETPEFPNEEIAQVLRKTMGVPLFQEQAMRLSMVAADFTPGEADQLRRAMGAWRRHGVIEKFRKKLMKGMQEKGLSAEFAEMVYRQIRGFGEYGFPESHAASFALIVYVSAWLKCHYPAAYTASMINSWPLGFYQPGTLIRDLRENQREVRPVDLNRSDWDCTLEPTGDEAAPFALRLGFRLIGGLQKSVGDTIVAQRNTGYSSLDDLAKRCQFSKATLEKLAQADIFRSLNLDRRQALWMAKGQESSRNDMPLFSDVVDEEELPVQLPNMNEQQQVFADYSTLGLSLRSHPMSFYRKQLEEIPQRPTIVPFQRLKELRHNQHVRIAGLVLLRQRPSTAKGITFVTLEDETGVANLVIHQRTWERFYSVAKKSNAWIVTGRVERKHEVIHIVVARLEDMSSQLGSLDTKSRDFR